LIIGSSNVHQATEPEQWFRWPVKNDTGREAPGRRRWEKALDKPKIKVYQRVAAA
jgi:hypothetical protein